jgi:hypothetical protein
MLLDGCVAVGYIDLERVSGVPALDVGIPVIIV